MRSRAPSLKLLGQLAEKHGTPLFVVDHREIRRNYALFRKHLPRVQPYYAVKANPDPDIVRTLFKAGASFDVASMPEFMIVHENIAKMPAKKRQDWIWDKIIYANPVKDNKTLADLDAYKPLVTYDDLAEVGSFRWHVLGALCDALQEAKMSPPLANLYEALLVLLRDWQSAVPAATQLAGHWPDWGRSEAGRQALRDAFDNAEREQAPRGVLVEVARLCHEWGVRDFAQDDRFTVFVEVDYFGQKSAGRSFYRWETIFKVRSWVQQALHLEDDYYEEQTSSYSGGAVYSFKLATQAENVDEAAGKASRVTIQTASDVHTWGGP
jgi:hypothetical protein